MSIATQIQRLINAKNAIKSSIINKSVAVNDTTKLDGYGALINNIGINSNIGPADVIKGKMAFGNNGKYFSGTALSVQTSANNMTILNGFTAYDSNGNLINGAAMPNAATALNNRIMNGYTAYDNKGKLLKGNAFGNNTNATNSSLLKGHTAYLNNGMWLNGTAFGNNTNAINAVILNGYTAYLNNGFYLQGTALNNTTSAFNNKILKGFTAYNSNGGWLVGTALGNTTSANNTVILNGYTAYDSNGNWLVGNAFGKSTNVTNEMIFTGMTAYLNNGTYLTGTMRNRAGLAQDASNFFANNSYVVMQPSVEGYYDTASKLRYNLNNALTAMNAVRIATGTVVAEDDECVFIEGLSFKPKGVVLIYGDEEVDYTIGDQMETPIVTWDFDTSGSAKCHSVYYRDRSEELRFQFWSSDAAEIDYYNGGVDFYFDTNDIDADWSYNYIVWG